MDIQYYKDNLEKAGVVFASGLSQNEIQRIEQEYSFRFPPDLKEFLMFALPISKGFVDWRQWDREQIGKILSWPFEGICFDIEYNAFWLPQWGNRPASLDAAFAVAKDAIEAAPTLIPIYSHRYIPDNPCESGNPVFSVCQTDIIYYGHDLANYLENEFRSCFVRSTTSLKRDITTIKHIDFWSHMADGIYP